MPLENSLAELAEGLARSRDHVVHVRSAGVSGGYRLVVLREGSLEEEGKRLSGHVTGRLGRLDRAADKMRRGSELAARQHLERLACLKG